MNNSKKLNIVSFVGPSGSGKSSAIKEVVSEYKVLPEKYMELNQHGLDNRLMLSKWAYINYWFDNVLLAKTSKIDLLLTDRCPLDTCAYVRNGSQELLQVLQLSIDELMERDIFVKKILVTADFEILQTRIENRLKIDRRRVDYNEENIAHNRRAYDFFANNEYLWDRKIDTCDISKMEVLAVIKKTIESIIDDLI